MPKVSVIVPVYNTEKYLTECLESIKNQTLTDLEVICINDGSTDSSLKILKDFASKDSRFAIVDKQNEGQGIARNIGIAGAQGEYTLCMDSDDWLEENALEKAYNKIKTDNADILIFDYYRFKEKKQRKSLHKNTSAYSRFNSQPFSPQEAGKSLLLCNSLPFKMYKTEFLQNNDIKYSNHKFMEDAPFYIKAMIHAQKITCLEEPISNYRVHKKSCTFNYDKYFVCIPEVYNICFNIIQGFEKNRDILDSFLENRKQTLLYFYNLTPFTQKSKYYKMMQEIIKNYFLKYDYDKELKEICSRSFLKYEIHSKFSKTKLVLKTHLWW